VEILYISRCQLQSGFLYPQSCTWKSCPSGDEPANSECFHSLTESRSFAECLQIVTESRSLQTLISACPLLLGTFSSAESKWCSTLHVLIFNLDPNFLNISWLGNTVRNKQILCPKFSPLFPHNRHWKKKVLHKSGSFYVTRFRDFFFLVEDPAQFLSNSSEGPEKKLCFLKAGSCIISTKIKQRVLFYISPILSMSARASAAITEF